MCNSETFEQREQRLKALIDNPRPQPQYQLWQTVRYKTGYQNQCVRKARICGFHFVRVAIALAEECEPGWRYHIEGVETTEIIYEDEIVEAVNDEQSI